MKSFVPASIFLLLSFGISAQIRTEVNKILYSTLSSYTFVITSLPTNTPHDASIYLAGNFNNWNTDNRNFKFQKQHNGQYQVVVLSSLPIVEYKITRGNWASVEGRKNGKARANRFVNRSNKNKDHIVKIEVENWEDLAGNMLSIYDFLVILSAFQGFLLIVAISTIQDYNQAANRLLVIAIGITSMALLVRVASVYRDIFQLYPKLILIPDFIIFLFAPTFYLYIQKLLTSVRSARWYYHYIPALLHLFVYLPLFFMEREAFMNSIVDRSWVWLFASLGGISFFSNLYYWYICRKVLHTYKVNYTTSHSYEQNLQYLNTAMVIITTCLCLWFFACTMMAAQWFFGFDTLNIAEKSTDAIWLALSVTPYFLGYFAIHQPEIFKIAERISFLGEVKVIPTKPKTSDHQDENILLLKPKVEAYMKNQKPYINPKLTLNDLAEKLKIHPNTLSKVINDGFEKNFFDLINSYRVEEFKKRMSVPQFKTYTLLAIAFEVGFNSKTAFNRSFKKLTNQTPKEYYQLLE